MKLEIVKDMIEKAGVATFGEDLFIGMMPLEAQIGVLLRHSGIPIDHELPGYFKGQFRIVARAPAYLDAQELMQRVTQAITVRVETRASGVLVRYLRAVSTPAPFPVSDGDLIEFNCNFDIAYIED